MFTRQCLKNFVGNSNRDTAVDSYLMMKQKVFIKLGISTGKLDDGRITY